MCKGVKKILFPEGILFINSIDYEATIKLIEELKKTYIDVSYQKLDLNYLITCNSGSD